MKTWFPFTDYDFYAYLATGLTILFALDANLNDGKIILRDTWPFIQIVFAISMSYVVGQLAAGFASIIFEHWLARKVLHPPTTILLCLKSSRWREKFVRNFIVGRYYEPFPKPIRGIVLNGVAEATNITPADIKDPETVFQVAFPIARSIPDTVTRLDDFRKLYGFSRNMSFAGMIASGAFFFNAHASDDGQLFMIAVCITIASIMLCGRFLKFYSAYTAEVLRTYASARTKEQTCS